MSRAHRQRDPAAPPPRLPKLRPYQLAPGRAILESVAASRGDTLTVMMSRQAGKNELSAQLELSLLVARMKSGGQGIKLAPTFRPQLVNSILRLEERAQDWGPAVRALLLKQMGYIVHLGRARWLYLSASESSNVVGATASILMEVDEAQDVDRAKFDKEFRPMAATTNATTVMYGTAWDDSNLLEVAAQRNLELERKDGRRRHFEYPWPAVAEHNPLYAAFVASERDRLGADHPLFQTQYELKRLANAGKFLSEAQRGQIAGDHARIHVRSQRDKVYIAGVDLAGEDEEAEDAALRSLKPRKDSIVATIAELSPNPHDAKLGHNIRIVQHYYRTGVKHAALQAQLLDVLDQVWGCRKIVVDATGVGGATARYLEEKLGSVRVEAFLYTAQTKSDLAYAFLAAVNAGRVKMYAEPDGQSDEARAFWAELALARYALRANNTMNFFVDPTEGHDDFLQSTALVIRAADIYQSRTAKGR